MNRREFLKLCGYSAAVTMFPSPEPQENLKKIYRMEVEYPDGFPGGLAKWTKCRLYELKKGDKFAVHDSNNDDAGTDWEAISDPYVKDGVWGIDCKPNPMFIAHAC